jgi:hypothetical protein
MDGKNNGLLVFVREWLAPVAVASAFALALAGIFEFIDSTEQPAGKPHPRSRSMPRAPRVTSGPRFVIAIPRSGAEVVVRDVRNGAVVGNAALAGQRFQQVAAAGDGTYVVSSYRKGRVSFDRLRLDAKGGPAEFTPLVNAGLSGVSTKWSDLAVSGDRIAYVTYLKNFARIQIVSISTGARQTWMSTVGGSVTSLSWAGPRLAFVWIPLRTGKRQVRLLDTLGSGGALSSSRLLLTLPAGTDAAVLSQDGKTVLTGVTQPGGVAVAEFSAVTRERTGVMWQRQTQGAVRLAQLKPDSTGTHLLATTTEGEVVTDPAHDLPAQPTGDLDAAW